MGHFRFRKSIKIAPGVKLNLNKNSRSITFGGKGAHYTANSNGSRTSSFGIPGTGLSYVDTQSKRLLCFKNRKNKSVENYDPVKADDIYENNSSKNQFSKPEEKSKLPVYRRNWFILLMLFFATPAGIFLMWYCKEWKTFIKVIISVFFIFYFMMYCEVIALMML